MTSRRTVAILYTLHSWAGVLLGVWVFVVGLTGALLVFKSELDRWANPSVARAESAAIPVGPDAVLHHLAREQPWATPTFLVAPTASQPGWTVLTRGRGERQREKFVARADTGELVGIVDGELGQFIRNIHVFLIFGPRWPVGFLGVVVLFLTVSGLIIHRKVLRELFTLRWGRSLRVVSADVHRAVGVWGLGFHVLIAFTGAWLGLAPVVEGAVSRLGAGRAAPEAPAPAPAAIREASRERGTSPADRTLDRGAAGASLDRLLDVARAEVPGLHVSSLALSGWGTSAASVRVNGRSEGSISADVELRYSAQGELLERFAPSRASFWWSFERLMEPLHFGDFGGPVLRWIYFGLGLAQAGLALSGTLVWLERAKLRARDGAALAAQAARG